ncbi:Cellulose synthase-like protein D1 [Ananas comosus]|uniref:Cellulose synthase-like protein D1 n=1 Tax=Ananas comosus TaxID=4615 RepID=A0A199VY91_ANACO|nr:Cellulose synthase-like protein D1 [Ananas comosus]
MATKGILKNSPSGRGGKPPLAPQQQQQASSGPTVVFGQRTDSGRFISYSRDDLDSEVSSVDYQQDYHVHIPMTPDNQPFTDDGRAGPRLGPSLSAKSEDSFVSDSLFTGGFNTATHARAMDKPADPSRGAGAGAKSTCAVDGCDNKLARNARGEEAVPCECDFRTCADCFADAAKAEGGLCPGCKEPYKTTDWEEVVAAGSGSIARALSLRPAPPRGKAERGLSLMRQTTMGRGPGAGGRGGGGEFDHNRWLFETKGTYGYGNAMWPEDNADEEGDGDGGGGHGHPQELMSKPWRPLTRKLKIPAAVISPYRLLVFVRMAALALFLAWRITHKNEDAVWLWGMSIVCELWFAFSWLLDQLPKLCPVNRAADLAVLKEKFETPRPNNPTGKSDLPGIDVFVSTADPDKEPVLVTANTVLSILAADYPVEKLACYLSDDGGALLTFEAMAEAANFADLWVPFCRKHRIEPRNPESYFSLKRDPYRNKVKQDFVKDRRRIKREYDEFKVRINGLPEAIRSRSDALHAREEIQQAKAGGDEPVKIPKATWMADATHWPGTWLHPSPDHTRTDHAGIIQVMLKPPSDAPMYGSSGEKSPMDLGEVDVRLPMLVYVSREKRPGYDHNKKAGAMNALVRASAIMSNGPFILNLDCDHYVYNSQALREGMCFMMDRGGDRICYVQFPQRFEGIDPSDRYANHNTVFFDVNMRALDGLQGPVYVGTGCLFRRVALYGFDPPRAKEHRPSFCGCCLPRRRRPAKSISEETRALRTGDTEEEEAEEEMSRLASFPKKFGNSSFLMDSIPVAEFQGRPLADHPSVKNGRPVGALTVPREVLDASVVAEAISVVSCWYEEKTEWGRRVGWIYGSVTEDVVTGYRMHNRGWRSVYCVTQQRDAFRGTAPINLTDRLHQVLRWATGSVEIFFSRNNALFASPRMKALQRVAYLNVGIYPFTSVFLVVYCFLPALSLFSGQFIVQTLNVAFLAYLLVITLTLCLLALLEVRWSGIELEEWWRNEQFWLIGGTSAHLAAVLQGLLKVVAGIEISFTLTSKSAGDDVDDEFAELYAVRWTWLMVPPLAIIMVNLIAICVGFSRTVYSVIPQWTKLLGGVFFSFWVLAHLYPFAKGLMGRRGRTPTVVYVWSGLVAITISLLWVAIKPPSANSSSQSQIGGSFSLP